MSIHVEKSGVHLTGADSGWPVGADTEPHAKDGTGTDVAENALSVADHVVTDDGANTGGPPIPDPDTA